MPCGPRASRPCRRPCGPGKLLATDQNAPFGGWPAGMGFIPVSDDVVIVGGPYGPVTWDSANRRARFGMMQIHPHYAAPYVDRLVGHPTLPVLYSGLVRT